MESPYEQFRELRPEKKIIVNKLKREEFESILEVGCQWGENLKAIKDKFIDKRIVGVDIDREILEEAKKITGLDLRYGNALKLDFKKGEFDIVFTNALFCMLKPEEVRRAFKEIIRVAKKKIILIELETDELIGMAKWRTGANWIKLFEKYGWEAKKKKISRKVWNAEPWISCGYYYEAIRKREL